MALTTATLQQYKAQSSWIALRCVVCRSLIVIATLATRTNTTRLDEVSLDLRRCPVCGHELEVL